MKILELVFVYALGAIGYGGIESLWRGHTHWTMLLLGGACFVLIYALSSALPRWPLWKQGLLCALAIVALEFLTGCLLNLALGWAVWDYRDYPGNLLGQVCPMYAALWYLLSLPCIGLSALIRRWLFPDTRHPRGQS